MTLRRPAAAVALLVAAAVASAVPVASAQTLDNNPTYAAVRATGPSANRVDMVFVGDGFTASQIETAYVAQIGDMLGYMFDSRLNDPFPRYSNFFNVHRVNVVSQQSGADDPNAGVTRDTALGATYNYDGVTDRLLYFNTAQANAAVNKALAGRGIDVDMRLGVVNAAKYGGGGGQWAVWAGANASATDVAVHELGHSFGGLQDEYSYGGPAAYAGSERNSFVNVSTTPQAKWGQWYGYDDPYHNGTAGTSNMSVVGAYEGGQYSETGIFRPTQDSKMRSLFQPFNAVSREELILDIFRDVDPLDGFLSNAATLIDPDVIFVDTVDPAVIAVDWFLDGVLVSDGGPEAFDFAAYAADAGLAAGDYTFSALAYDTVLDNAFSGLDFDWVRRDQSLLQQQVTWNVRLTAVPEPASAGLALAGLLALGSRRRRA